MEISDLRAKWQKSINEVDEDFLRLVEKMYENYKNQEDGDFFDELPIKVQKLLSKSKIQSENNQVAKHEDFISEIRKKYNVRK